MDSMKELTRDELIRYYHENKGKAHVVKDEFTGRTFQISEEEWKRSIEEEIYNKLPIRYRLAIVLHNKLCRYNHTDACSWFYEVQGFDHSWHASGHSPWVKKADDIIRAANGRADDDTIYDIINAI